MTSLFTFVFQCTKCISAGYSVPVSLDIQLLFEMYFILEIKFINFYELQPVVAMYIFLDQNSESLKMSTTSYCKND